MAVSYTKEQEELLRKLRGEGSNANAFPDAYNPPSLLSQSQVFKPQPPSNPPLQNLLGTNPAASLSDPYKMAINPPRTIGAPPVAVAPPATPHPSGREQIGNLIGPPIDYIRSFFPSPRKVLTAIDSAVPNANKPSAGATPANVTAISQVAAPATATQYRPARPGEIDPTVRNRYDVKTTEDAVKFSNEIGGGEISGLTPKQVSRISNRLTNGYRDTNVVPSSFFTGGAAQGSQIPGFDEDSIARLTRAANERVDIGNMRPADAATALSERNYARQQLQQIRTAMAGGANAQQQANAEVQKAIAIEQIRRSSPEWKSSDTEVVDPKSPTGVRKVQVLSAPDGRTYQVPDAQDIATLAAAPNDEERIRLLRLSGVPDEHIPTYLARFR